MGQPSNPADDITRRGRGQREREGSGIWEGLEMVFRNKYLFLDTPSMNKHWYGTANRAEPDIPVVV
jgi:hypothetical protein